MAFAEHNGYSSPARTIRPGDLLGGDGVPNLIDTAEKLNATGVLVGACSTTALVYIGWGIQFLSERMHSGQYSHSVYNAVVFGPREAVREKFIDVHRALGGHIRSMRNRTMELQNGIRIVFVYLDEAEVCHGMHFHSVWIVGENYNLRHEEWLLPVPRQETQRPELGEVRSGYRGAVRAQYVRDGADRNMVQREMNPLVRAEGPTEREQELRRELDFLTQQLAERTQRFTTTTSSPLLGPGVGSNAQMQVPTVTGGLIGGRWTPEDLGLEAKKPEEPSEPIRFPEKRTFLKEDDE